MWQDAFNDELEKLAAEYMYHGSPHDFSLLEDRSPKKGGIFLTPYPGVASIFIVDKTDVQQGIPYKYFGTGYKEWGYPKEELAEPLKNVRITHNDLELPPGKGISSGFLYKVDVSDIKEQLERVNKTKDEPRERVYRGKPLPYVEKTPIELTWTSKGTAGRVKKYGPAVRLEMEKDAFVLGRVGKSLVSGISTRLAGRASPYSAAASLLGGGVSALSSSVGRALTRSGARSIGMQRRFLNTRYDPLPMGRVSGTRLSTRPKKRSWTALEGTWQDRVGQRIYKGGKKISDILSGGTANTVGSTTPLDYVAPLF